jgi:hypothetical protein
VRGRIAIVQFEQLEVDLLALLAVPAGNLDEETSR